MRVALSRAAKPAASLSPPLAPRAGGSQRIRRANATKALRGEQAQIRHTGAPQGQA